MPCEPRAIHSVDVTTERVMEIVATQQPVQHTDIQSVIE